MEKAAMTVFRIETQHMVGNVCVDMTTEIGEYGGTTS